MFPAITNEDSTPCSTAALNASVAEADSQVPVLGYTIPYAIANVLLTGGSKGARVIGDAGDACVMPAPQPESMVDTVGAGDSYSGAFCFAWFHTKDLEKSARFAQDVADRVVSQAGALPDYGEEILTRAREMATG